MWYDLDADVEAMLERAEEVGAQPVYDQLWYDVPQSIEEITAELNRKGKPYTSYDVECALVLLRTEGYAKPRKGEDDVWRFRRGTGIA